MFVTFRHPAVHLFVPFYRICILFANLSVGVHAFCHELELAAECLHLIVLFSNRDLDKLYILCEMDVAQKELPLV